MYALGLAGRWLHLAGLFLLVGGATAILLAGRSDRATARRWESLILRGSAVVSLLTLVAGLALLAAQAAELEGRAAAALEPATLGRVVLETQGGRLWLVRQSLLVLLAAFLTARWNVERALDWRAARGEAALLGAAALALVAATGHAAAAEPDVARALGVDALHLVAGGVWAGTLVPLAVLLRASAREEGADARPYAVLAARRFSRWALGAVLVLAATGGANAVEYVGSVAGLVGTLYGRLLLLKLVLLAAILGFAAVNRRRHLPRLGGDAATVGRPAMRRLARFVGWEAALALALLAVVAAMTTTPPALHDSPDWPFPLRLTTAALEDTPGATGRVLVGSQLAILGLVGFAAAALLRGWRLALGAGALVAVAAGGALALPPLAVDAYPTTYRTPPVAYQAASIAAGAALFAANCAVCHGATGAGDGPGAAGLPRPPADLRAAHTAQHTVGDLFWWIGRGIPRAGMPAFGARLAEEERWDLINYLRALSTGAAARRPPRALGESLGAGAPWLVAPDFSFAVGPTPPRSLREFRGRRIVVLVLYALPGSRARMDELARAYDTLAALGAEIVAVPVDGAADALARLGAAPPVLFPVVTEGAAEIATAYRLLADAPHAELLIDRQGYVRAIAAWRGRARGANALLADVQRLNEERAVAPAPDEHVH